MAVLSPFQRVSRKARRERTRARVAFSIPRLYSSHSRHVIGRLYFIRLFDFIHRFPPPPPPVPFASPSTLALDLIFYTGILSPHSCRTGEKFCIISAALLCNLDEFIQPRVSRFPLSTRRSVFSSQCLKIVPFVVVLFFFFF